MTDLIMVKPPYNILYDLEINSNGSLSAKVENEYQCKYEGGPIGVAEVGRHIAILGSMCLAKDYGFEDAHYFLAAHADLERKTLKTSESRFLSLTAKTKSISKRKGQIQGEIYDEHQGCIFAATVDYQVLSTSTFDRLFGCENSDFQFNQNLIGQSSPYRYRKELAQVTIQDNTASGLHEIVLPDDCAGHFPTRSALPVAIIGNYFIDLGMRLFQNFTDRQFSQSIVLATSINASRLVFAGKQICFSVKIKQILSDELITISGMAMVGDEIVSDIEFTVMGRK